MTCDMPETTNFISPEGRRIANDPPHVALLMCTHQGEAFLANQLDSIAQQTYTNWRLWVSDDGSTDNTLALLAKYRSRWGEGRLSIVKGLSAGSVFNFLSLTGRPEVQAKFFAWSDQDDVWASDKLARAVAYLESMNNTIATLYSTRTLLTDANDRLIGKSPLFKAPPHFANALVQSLAGGNTMVFNQAARDLLVLSGPHVTAVAHDWWAYLLVTACGGRVHYDPYPTVRYRQHAHNQIGAGPHPLARVWRLRQLLNGQFSRWIDANLASLSGVRQHMTAHNQVILETFANSRRKALLRRLLGLRKSGVHRQTFIGNVGLFFAAIFKRL